MDLRDAVPLLEAIIARERQDGCPMADEGLIGPALRRWKSYERRNRQSKDQSFEHRVLDLKKGLLALFPDLDYDEACLAHLAQSFAEALARGPAASPSKAHDQPGD